MIRQLQGSGSFSDMGQLNSLMDVARKDLVLSRGWDQTLFRRIGDLAGGQVRYQTLPVVRYDTVDGQDVNIVDPTAIRALVATTFSDTSPAPSSPTPAPLAPSDVTVDVVNAAGVTGLATETSNLLDRNGYRQGELDVPHTDESSNAVSYGPGANAAAQSIATMLGVLTPLSRVATWPPVASGWCSARGTSFPPTSPAWQRRPPAASRWAST